MFQNQLQLRINDFKNATEIEQKIEHLIDKIVSAGSDPTWDLYSNTFGWFDTKQTLSEEEIIIVEIAWRNVYDKTIQPLKDEHGEDKFDTILNLNLMRTAPR